MKLTKEFVTEFSEKYISNLDALNKWNERLQEEHSEDEWFRLLKERSRKIRDIYDENQQLLKRLYEALPDTGDSICAEDAAFAQELVHNLYHKGIDDVSILMWLAEHALSYYEGTDDYDSIISLNLVLGNELAVFFRLIHDPEGTKKALDAYRKVISCKDHFGELTTNRAKTALIYSYYNLPMFTGHFEAGGFGDCYALYKEAVEFYSSPAVVAETELADEVSETLKELTSEILSCAVKLYIKNKEEEELLNEFLKDTIIPLRDKNELDIRSEMIVSLLLKETSEAEWCDKYVTWLEENVPTLNYENSVLYEEISKFSEYHSLSLYLVTHLQECDLTEEQRTSYTRRVLNGMLSFVEDIPYPFLTEMVNSMLAEWFNVAGPLLESAYVKREVLFKFIIRRQPVTFIHSSMVEAIVTLIGSKILEVKPELFGDIDDDDILSFITECAFVHDVGKCLITDVINRQNRALTESEFAFIKRHPSLGVKVATVAALEPYKDVIYGHHKSYDGKRGYPEDFDNTASPIRFVIDLISIADSIDAATDILGRNYASGKNFDDVFRELEEGAGTRYNPDIVNIISENRELYDDLYDLTGKGRFEIYRDCYREIMRR